MGTCVARRLKPEAAKPSGGKSDKAEKVQPEIRRTLTMGPNGRSHMRLYLQLGWDASSSPGLLPLL
ncbi:uncharacterized protein Dvar_50120 [Desulfosarcina variabilis str. Montpellier]